MKITKQIKNQHHYNHSNFFFFHLVWTTSKLHCQAVGKTVPDQEKTLSTICCNLLLGLRCPEPQLWVASDMEHRHHGNPVFRRWETGLSICLSKFLMLSSQCDSFGKLSPKHFGRKRPMTPSTWALLPPCPLHMTSRASAAAEFWHFYSNVSGLWTFEQMSATLCCSKNNQESSDKHQTLPTSPLHQKREAKQCLLLGRLFPKAFFHVIVILFCSPL